MLEKFISMRLLQELPKSLINFLWYLWEVYCNPKDEESHIMLQSCNKGLRVTIVSTGKTTEQDFGIGIDAVILIRKDELNYYMSRQ